MIKLKSLYFFKTVVEQGSISAASERLYIAQPALSKSLQNLETYFGVELLLRSNKGIKTTQAGQYLFQKACYLLNEANKIDHDMQLYGKGQRGLVRIGSVSMGWPYINHVINYSNKQNKHFAFSLLQGDTFFLEHSLKMHQIDLAFVHLPLTLLSEGVVITPLQHAKFRALCHKESPLAKKQRVTLTELASEPLALLRKQSGYGVYDKVMQCFAKAGITPSIQFDASDVTMLVNLVQAKLAVALMPILDEMTWPDIVTLEILELDSVADDLVLVYLAQHVTAPLRQMIELITADVSIPESQA